MLNKPKFMTPSINREECVVDVSDDKILFSCIVDGNESISAWCIKIYKISDSSNVLNTGKVGLNSPFFPVNNKNQNVIFEKDIKTYLANSPEFINSASPYFWTISLWSQSDADEENPSVVSCEEAFYANETPNIDIKYSTTGDSDSFQPIENNPTMSQNNLWFKCSYDSATPIKKYGWRIVDSASNNVLIDTISNNQIYGVNDDITCSYDGFLNGCTYSVEVYIETQNGLSINQTEEFQVSYPTSILDSNFRVEVLKKESGVILDWTQATIIGGEGSNGISYVPNYPIVGVPDADGVYTSNSVLIPNNNYITFNYDSNSNLDIQEESYIVLSLQMPVGQDTVLFEASGVDNNGDAISRKLSYIDGKFIYSILGYQDVLITKEYTPSYSPSRHVWYVIVMSPILEDGEGNKYSQLIINESVAEGGKYPSKSLYPSATNYPSFGAWELKTNIS